MAMRHLSYRGFIVFYPTIAMPNAAPQPMFPGYLFVQFNPDTDNWQQIYCTMGVTHLFMLAPGKPCPIPVALINSIRQQSNAAQWHYRQPRPEQGDHVKIIDQNLQELDLTGICTMSTKERVEVLLIRLGKLTKVAFKPKSVVKA
jgi:transcription antitermination factor NusG